MKRFIKILILSLSVFIFSSCDDPNTGKNIVLQISPVVLNFNTISVGNTDAQTFTLKNIGDGTLEITSMNIKLNNSELTEELYHISNDIKFPIKIEKGETYEEVIEVIYTAKDVGDDVSGRIEITSNDSNKKVKTVYLNAEKANPKLKTSVDTIIFNKLGINESETLDLVVSNTGTSALKFVEYDGNGAKIATDKDAFYFGVGSSDSFELLDLSNVRTLEPAKFEDNKEIFDSFTIKVKYTAKGEGTETGTLKIFNNSTNASPQKIINIIASSESCNLILQPQDGYIDFGERPQGSENSFTVLLANTGSFECNIRKIELDVAASSPEFSIEIPENTEFPTVINPSERFQFKVHFKPTEETTSGGAAGIINLESDDEHWNGGEKKLTLYGRSKEDNSPVCIIKNLYGGEPYFEVEPGQIENTECRGSGICSNVQMISESYDPNPDNSGELRHSWQVVETPGPYSNPDWKQFPSLDPNSVSNSDKHYVDFYVPYATPHGTKYLIELTVTSSNGASSQCYAEVYGLTGNSLHVELFWDEPSDVDLHLLNPTDQNLNIDDISIENPSLDTELEDWRMRTNFQWWDGSYSSDGQDCYFSNCKGDGISWGEPGPSDDPSLDRDDVTNIGPENINITKPKEGWYRVSIHYYRNDDKITDASVRVYCNGTVAYMNTATLKDKDHTWLVNDIFWKDLGSNDGECYIFSDGRIFDSRQGEGGSGYRGTLLEDIEPDAE